MGTDKIIKHIPKLREQMKLYAAVNIVEDKYLAYGLLDFCVINKYNKEDVINRVNDDKRQDHKEIAKYYIQIRQKEEWLLRSLMVGDNSKYYKSSEFLLLNEFGMKTRYNRDDRIIKGTLQIEIVKGKIHKNGK